MKEKESLTRPHAFIFPSPNLIAQQRTLKYSLKSVKTLAHVISGVKCFPYDRRDGVMVRASA